MAGLTGHELGLGLAAFTRPIELQIPLTPVTEYASARSGLDPDDIEQDEPRPGPSARDRIQHGREQCHRVGMARGLEDHSGCSGFDHATSVEHQDSVGHGANDAEIMRDEQVREGQPLPELAQQIDHPGTNRCVQCAGRLITDDVRRVERQRPGNRCPLELPTGELVRAPVGLFRVEANTFEELIQPGIGVPS